MEYMLVLIAFWSACLAIGGAIVESVTKRVKRRRAVRHKVHYLR